MTQLEKYIEKANSLIEVDHDSPKVGIFIKSVEQWLKTNLGKDWANSFTAIMWGGVFFPDTDFQVEHREKMKKAAEFLQELVDEDISETVSTNKSENRETEKQSSTKRQVAITNSNVSFDNQGVVNQTIDINSYLNEVIKEVEKAKDTPEKKRIIAGLKAITENPTFASIAGSVLSTMLNQ